MKNYVFDEKLVNAIVNYLMRRPYMEVSQLLDVIDQVMIAQDKARQQPPQVVTPAEPTSVAK